MDVAAIRRQFPVTERMVFLNNAAESPLSLPVRRRLDEYLDQAACAPDKRPPARHPVRPLLSRLLGGSADEYALVTSTAASQEANRAIHARLGEQGIGISLRGGQCRVSPSFYNTEEEIDRLLASLA